MRAGAVIVAAGMSTRMKQFKQMMKIGNFTLAERVAINFKRAGIQDIVMVTGYHGRQLEAYLNYLDIEFVKNEQYEHTDMLESAKIGLYQLQNRCDKILFCPADIPFFTDETVKAVLGQNAEIVVPRCGGKSGHKILFEWIFQNVSMYFRNEICSFLMPTRSLYKNNFCLMAFSLMQ